MTTSLRGMEVMAHLVWCFSYYKWWFSIVMLDFQRVWWFLNVSFVLGQEMGECYSFDGFMWIYCEPSNMECYTTIWIGYSYRAYREKSFVVNGMNGILRRCTQYSTEIRLLFCRAQMSLFFRHAFIDVAWEMMIYNPDLPTISDLPSGELT